MYKRQHTFSAKTKPEVPRGTDLVRDESPTPVTNRTQSDKPTWFRTEQCQFEMNGDQVKRSGLNSIPDVASSCYWFQRLFGTDAVLAAVRWDDAVLAGTIGLTW